MNKAMTREPSKDAWILCFFLSMIFAVSLIFIPLILANGKPSNKSNNVVPKYGTAEYQEFVAQFEEEHGRPWGISDQMSAMKNGAAVMAGYFSACFAFVVLYLTIHDCVCFFKEKRAYRMGFIREMPYSGKTQLIHTAINFCGLLLLVGVGFITFINPFIIQSIS